MNHTQIRLAVGIWCQRFVLIHLSVYTVLCSFYILLVGDLQPAYLCLPTHFKGSKPLFLQTSFYQAYLVSWMLNVCLLGHLRNRRTASTWKDKHDWGTLYPGLQATRRACREKQNKTWKYILEERHILCKLMVMNLMSQGCCTCVSPAFCPFLGLFHKLPLFHCLFIHMSLAQFFIQGHKKLETK